jgi:two-component system phosphate regulon sensor histidine kinase PhoR
MKGKEIEFFDSSTEDYSIKADKRRVLEVLTNLVQNAHDFVPVKGIIEIGVNDEKDKVTFFVKDNGIGIPKEKQDQIFKKYGEIKTGMTRTYGGTGLGLVVSKELVEGMSGKIWLESEKGKGTVFLFTIPKA